MISQILAFSTKALSRWPKSRLRRSYLWNHKKLRERIREIRVICGEKNYESSYTTSDTRICHD